MSGIVLSAGVRQNLLSLQSTAQLMSTTQYRLATGKKVNSALDNPANYFSSLALSNRASDLNSLLDSIGQAQQALQATDTGLTSLTKLVQSAKSITTQARQSTASTTTYAAVNANSDIGAASNLNGNEIIASTTASTGVSGGFAAQAIALNFTGLNETLGQLTGQNNAAAAATATGNIVITVNGADNSVPITSGDTYAQIRTKINNANLGVTASDSGGKLQLVANNADVDFSINTGASNAQLITDINWGTPAGNGNSTSLLDQIVANGGVSGSSQLVINVNGGAATKTITFGTGAGQISTFAELNTELTVNGVGGTASGSVSNASFASTTPPVNAPHLLLNNTSGATHTLAVSVSDLGVRSALGLGAARGIGQTGGIGNTVSALSRTYNSAATLADTDPTNLLNGGNLIITVNGSSQTVGLLASDHLTDIISKLQANATLSNNLTFADNGSGNLKITANNADVDFQVSAGATASGIGLATTAQNSTSLLDLLNAKLGGSNGQGATLTVSVDGGAAQTLTFGSGPNQISTLAELSTSLSGLSGVNATLSGTSLNLQVPSGTSATSLTIGGTAAAAFGIGGSQTGAVSSTTTDATRASLQTDFNNVLDQIDALAKDTSYNGINLLYGDDLKVIFNEKGTSSLTITGVTFTSAGLGLAPISGSGFQSNSTVDTTLDSLNAALTTLRTQATKFGATLTTVQVRQDFTKNLVSTLQVGSDNLVLADSNEEGANMLALQTRQQLSTTALSLANQASQAVLRLFG
jgi:flagellin